jgi:hypothetical protein
MHGQMIIIHVSGIFETTEYDDMEIPLEDIQEAVDGHIEVVPYWDTYNGDECLVFCNEDGKHIGKQRNITATALWDKVLVKKNMTRFKDGEEVDYLVGDIAVVMGDDAFMRTL